MGHCGSKHKKSKEAKEATQQPVNAVVNPPSTLNQAHSTSNNPLPDNYGPIHTTYEGTMKPTEEHAVEYINTKEGYKEMEKPQLFTIQEEPKSSITTSTIQQQPQGLIYQTYTYQKPELRLPETAETRLDESANLDINEEKTEGIRFVNEPVMKGFDTLTASRGGFFPEDVNLTQPMSHRA